MGEARRRAESGGHDTLADELFRIRGASRTMALRAFAAVRVAERWLVDAPTAYAANEAAYNDMTFLTTVLDGARTQPLPLWFEYVPEDRNHWYAERGLTVAPPEHTPTVTGVLVTRDDGGRLAIDHAFKRGGVVDFSPLTAIFNATNADVPKGEMKAGADFLYRLPTPETSRLTDEERATYRSMFDRLSFRANAIGEPCFAALTGEDLLRFRGAALLEAQEEAFYALGMLAVRNTGRTQ